MRRVSCLLALAVCVGAVPSLADAHTQTGGPVSGPVVFTPEPDTVLRIEGRGPYRGTLEVDRGGGGLRVVNDVDLESYVMGVEEVPGRWPMEALKAQAVASRTYALWEKANGVWEERGYDTCATVACQVYSGALAERGEEGRRWVEAVRATRGEVLFEGGEPILARYHASSGGRTLPNEAVYPSSGPRSYLEGVEDPYDEAASPLHEWTVVFEREQMQEILRVGIGLAGTLVSLEADPEARTVQVRTEGGELEMNAVRLRRVVSEHAPRLYPDSYPAPRTDGRLMPLTLPSSRFTIEGTDDGFRFRGRGYGHGVGMSQWGAKGRAEAGHSYEEILAAYYGGLHPEPWGGEDTLRVAVADGASDVRIDGDGAFSVRAAGDQLAEGIFGTWSVLAGTGGALQLTHPEGFELPLVLSGVVVPEEVAFDPPRETTLDVEFVLPKAAEVHATVHRGDTTVARRTEVLEPGARRLSLPLDGERLAQQGTYELNLRASDGTDEVHHAAAVRIVQPGLGRLLPGIIAFLVLLAAATSIVWRYVWRPRQDGEPPEPRNRPRSPERVA